MWIVVSVILLFLGIGVLVLIHVCIVGRTVGREISDRRNVNMAEGGSRSNSMSRDDIEKLPCFDFKAGGGSSPPSDCAVCLESFRDGERCRLLPSCSHCFHAECVDLWLLKTPICPICRTDADSVINSSSVGLRDLEANEGGVSSSSSNGERVIEVREEGGVSGVSEVGLSQTGELLDSSERVIEVREARELKF